MILSDASESTLKARSIVIIKSFKGFSKEFIDFSIPVTILTKYNGSVAGLTVLLPKKYAYHPDKQTYLKGVQFVGNYELREKVIRLG